MRIDEIRDFGQRLKPSFLLGGATAYFEGAQRLLKYATVVVEPGTIRNYKSTKKGKFYLLETLEPF